MNMLSYLNRSSIPAAALALTMSAHAGLMELSNLPLSTYYAPSSVDVKPNILFVLDDSGSMDWDAMPDQATWFDDYNWEYRPGNYANVDNYMPPYMRYNSGFNGVAYNPAIRYLPPVKYNADGSLDTTTYPSMTSANTAGWTAVKRDGYGVQSTDTSNLSGGVFAYVTVAGEYCDKPNLRTCAVQTEKSDTYPYAAKMRWCATAALDSNCSATWDSSRKYPRMPAPRIATITVGDFASQTNVTSITIDGLELLGAETGSLYGDDLATAIRNRINDCSNSLATAKCGTVGYWATRNNRTVTIYAPGTTTGTPVIVKSNDRAVAPTAFAKSTVPLPRWLNGTASSGTIPGENKRHTITSSVTSYAIPTDAKRTDCTTNVGSCTYAEEMTNYANWFAYYRTRMQLMKTAASQAFAAVDKPEDVAAGASRFRVGYMSLNNNTGSDFLNLDEFKLAHKNAWYAKLFAANPNSGTPLRVALSKAGRLYAGRLTSVNGVTATDPVQYSCQQNFTILSTDGFWNSGEGFKLDGSTMVGNQDGGMPPPYNDGGATVQKRTSSLQSQTVTQQAQKGTLQSRISQQQTRTSQLQKQTYSQLQTRTSTNSGSSWTAWSDVAAGSTCTWDTTTSSRRDCRYNGTTWSAWANAATCTPQAIGTSSANNTTWNHGVQCQYLDSAWVGVGGTCTPVLRDTTGTWSVPVARDCQTVPGTYADAASCAVTTPDASGNFTECQYRFDAVAGTQTCSPAYVANNFTNPVVYSGCTTGSSSWANAPSCTATTTWSTTGTKTNCQYTAWTSWGSVVSCAPTAQSTAPNYTVGTAVECQNIALSGGNSDTLADVAAYYYNTDLRKSTATEPDATGTCNGPSGRDLCANNVPPNDRDVANWQHMTTYSLGLGAQGKMFFSPTYWKDTSGDFHSVATGATADPANGICSWMASGRCVWPDPSPDNPANIDDLWHAAVNGRGSYFSATDPNSLATGLASTLAAIADTPRPGTSAAAASSNPNISAGDNYVFSSYYKSVDWYGDLYRQRLDIATKDLSPAVDWSAKALLDCATAEWAATKSYVAGDAYRNGNTCYLVTVSYVSATAFSSVDTDNSAIVSYSPPTCAAWAASTNYAAGAIFSKDGTCYYVVKAYTSGTAFGTADIANANAAYVAGAPTVRTVYTKGSSGLANFSWTGADSLSDPQKAYFKKPHISLSQFCTPAGVDPCLSATAQDENNITVASGGAAGEALVNYLRGDRSNEGTFFRTRKHVLGDIVSSEARYVKAPLFEYTDAGYSEYKTQVATRAGAVYVASNDGMLHAFNAETGKELWAYVPDMVLSQLHRLADINYSQNHRYYVDGTPEVGDICPTAPGTPCTGAQWKTIIVGGLNGGGKGYYALDITDPASPKLLWEFSNANLGYTYGNPRITKLKTGKWVVLFASGYNNSNGSDNLGGDGVGRLFVVDANSGALIRTIDTSAGSWGTPSGLARISAYSTTADTNNTTSAVYGGDMLGNLWRFDINNDIGAAGYDAQLLATFLDKDGGRQAVTAKPVVTTIDGKPVVYVGTGSYLTLNDIGSTQSQTMYAVRDKLDTTTYGNPRAGSDFVAQELVAATCGAEGTCTPGESIRKITSPKDVNWSSPPPPPLNNGWYVDFLTAGERANTDPALALGTLAFTTNTPNNASLDPCGDPGTDTSAAWFYALDYKTGGPVVSSNGVVARTLGNVIATRPVLVRLPDGSIIAIIRTSGGGSPTGGGTGGATGTAGYYPGGIEGGKTVLMPPPINPSGGTSRRVSWREITN
jgi:type IV pilus assembly protein PilY1